MNYLKRYVRYFGVPLTLYNLIVHCVLWYYKYRKIYLNCLKIFHPVALRKAECYLHTAVKSLGDIAELVLSSVSNLLMRRLAANEDKLFPISGHSDCSKNLPLIHFWRDGVRYLLQL